MISKLGLIEFDMSCAVETTRDITHVNTSCHASGCVRKPSRTLANSFDDIF